MTLQIETAMQRFEQPLLRYATRLLGDPERARDVVQDTFLRLCEVDGQQIERVPEWLYAVCRNRAIDVQRRERRLQLSGDRPPAQEPADSEHCPVRRCVLGEVAAQVEALPEAEGRVVKLRFGRGDSYQRISRQTGLSVGTVGYLIHTAVRRLRGQLGVTAALVLLIAAGALTYQARQASIRPCPKLERGFATTAKPAVSGLDRSAPLIIATSLPSYREETEETQSPLPAPEPSWRHLPPKARRQVHPPRCGDPRGRCPALSLDLE